MMASDIPREGFRAAATSTTPGDDDGLPCLLEELEVELTFSAGRASLSLADLRRLALGDPIDLRRATDTRVDILINGRQLGRGELIDLDGQLAVQILELRPLR